MIPRLAVPTLERLAKGFPVLAITGPRQSGKTTLARAVFAGKPYLSLENPQEREFAQLDPQRFLERLTEGAVLDEVQRCPQLLSWLQQLLDERKRMGDFILTGSAQFDLLAGISQSLAGRVGRVELLPLSGAELDQHGWPADLDEVLIKGGYPALYDRELSAQDWFPNYVATYLERDVRQLMAVHNVSQFHLFVRMCAARSGQLLNLSALGADCGISAVTASKWLSVLETSYLVMRLPPYHRNFGKRLVKTPKLYFLDVGLMAWLLGIKNTTTLETHPARGALFETWVVSELVKKNFNTGQAAELFFWRDNVGHEVDVLLETPRGLQAIEIKSGRTFASDWPVAVLKWTGFSDVPILPPRIVYGGAGSFQRQGCEVQGWREFALSLAA